MGKPDWKISKEKPFFVNDPEGDGLSFFSTIEDRDSYAEECIKEYIDDGWSEEVVNVIAGEVTHRATMTNRQDRPDDSDLDEDGCDEDGTYWNQDYAWICDYEMKPLKEGAA